MADIRKRTGAKGTTYQVRYADPSSETGYSYKTFDTAKEARAFREDSAARASASARHGERTVPEAVEAWLKVCEKEGRDGRAPVSPSTHKQYRYIADIIKSYHWQKDVAALTKPDIIEFRSWLITNHGRYLAAKTLRTFHGVLGEMATRGVVSVNVSTGVSVRKACMRRPQVQVGYLGHAQGGACSQLI